MSYSTYSYPPPANSLVNRAATSTLIGLILMIFYSQINTANAQTPLSFGQSYFDSKLGTAMLCGDLHGASVGKQIQLKDFHSGSTSLTIDPNALFQCGRFKVSYRDIELNFPGGFNAPDLGAQRRDAFCNVLQHIESIISIPPGANPTIEVTQSFDFLNPIAVGTSILGIGGPYYPANFRFDPGIFVGYLQQYIQTGFDPDPAYPFDAFITINFDKIYFITRSSLSLNYILPNETPNPIEYRHDLFSVLLHEMTHCLGFLGEMGENPNSLNKNLFCKNVANSFTKYDWLFGYYGEMPVPTTLFSNKLLQGTLQNPVINQTINQEQYPLRKGRVWINAQGPPMNQPMYAGHP